MSPPTARWHSYRAKALAGELGSYANLNDRDVLARIAHENARTEALCAAADALEEIARVASVAAGTLEKIEESLRHIDPRGR